MYLKGVISLTKGLLCKQEVLGKSYRSKISDIDVTITFPSPSSRENSDSINLVGLSNPLKAPVNGKNFKRGDEPIFWGYHMSFPDMDSFVKSIFLEAQLNEKQTPQELYDNITRWENSLISYCEPCSKQHFERKNTTHQNGSTVLELISEHGYVQNNAPFKINGIIHSSSQFVSEQQIADAIKFASSNMELLLEYQMLLSAYKSKKQNHNRQAIIDACSAAEFVLIKVIQEFCATKGIDSEILISKYRSLGERFDLVKKLDNNFPNIDYKKDIVKYRNDVAHNRNVYPSNEQTDTLISAIEQLLAHYHKNYY